MNLNIRHLLCALQIKKNGTLTQAANEIHLTQSALTQGINKLENILQHTLFNRLHSGMTTTEVGEQFLNRVERAFTHLEEFSKIVHMNKHKRLMFVRSVTIRQLNALINLLQQHSYTAAAAQLGLSQPTLHRSIKDLEQLCEQPLSIRSPAGNEPTWCAKQLYRLANLFFVELQQGIDEMNEFNGKINGSMRVGSLPLAMSSMVPRSVLLCNDEFPEANLSIIDGPYEEQLNRLRHGQIDVIVGALRFPVLHKDIIQQKLFTDQLSIVVKADHPLADREIISDIELQQLDWVAPAKSTPARHFFSEMFTRRGLIQPSHVIECSSLVGVRGILLNSERAALLPAKQVEVEVSSGMLSVCPMILNNTNREIGLAMRKSWHPTQMQARFLEIITSVISNI
jgi:LysR family transcriptional regulator of gallate degradation